MKLIAKIVMIGTPLIITALNAANYEGANILQPDMDEAVSSILGLITMIAGMVVLTKRN
jgi:hypothetical protein